MSTTQPNPELEAVRAAISAAKAASVASVRALDAVERLLGFSNTVPKPKNDVQEVRQGSQDDQSCNHGEAVEVRTVEGVFKVCPCGEQWVP